MNSAQSPAVRKRGRLMAIFGAMVADGSIILWLLGGPWQWLLAAGVGLFLTAFGLARGSRIQAPNESTSR